MAFLVVQGADAALAADLVQQAMITLYRRWPEVVSPRPWMFRTVSRDLVRAMSSVRESPTDEQGISPLLRPGQSGIEHWERRDDLMMQIRRLAPRQRQVMAWTMFEYTPTEIASELNLTPQAVRSILYQARNALIKAEAGQGEAADE
ncbi:RNA polymerase sigma factor [Actinokineospora cianjurensis]|uniref:RNA polymerase sigma factor n=1 Tax=Actinokineospora cianjurensis TaxID=585224 RepID=UPI000EAE178E|nr:sigma-70 family RNA polymerase sigma factor [Actinokineospora cianjurensis]